MCTKRQTYVILLAAVWTLPAITFISVISDILHRLWANTVTWTTATQLTVYKCMNVNCFQAKFISAEAETQPDSKVLVSNTLQLADEQIKLYITADSTHVARFFVKIIF